MPEYQLQNQKALAVVGAISMNRSWIHEKIVERSFNSDSFLEFIKELKEKT